MGASSFDTPDMQSPRASLPRENRGNGEKLRRKYRDISRIYGLKYAESPAMCTFYESAVNPRESKPSAHAGAAIDRSVDCNGGFAILPVRQ